MTTQLTSSRKKPSKMFRRVHAALILSGYSYASWAEARGYLPRTVIQSVHRYAGTKNQPQGRLTWRILCELSQELSIELVPGSLKEAA